MNIFLIAIGAGATIAIIVSISLLTIPDNRLHCTFCPSIPSPNQPIQITNITTEPSSVFVGTNFLIYADVFNPNPYPVFVNGGCFSSLSATFDKNVEIKKGLSCMAITNQQILPQHTARLHGPSTGFAYYAVGVGNTTAQITLTYTAQEKTFNYTATQIIEITNPPTHPTSTEFIGMVPAKVMSLDCKKPIGTQMKIIDESIDVQKAIDLAYTSPEFISKVNQYGTVTYNSFFNDWVTGDPCNTIWKGVEVVFTATFDNGTARNIQVSEDINLSKVLNVTEYQAGFSRG